MTVFSCPAFGSSFELTHIDTGSGSSDAIFSNSSLANQNQDIDYFNKRGSVEQDITDVVHPAIDVRFGAYMIRQTGYENGKFRTILASKYANKMFTELEFRLSRNNLHYDLWMFRLRSAKVYALDPTPALDSSSVSTDCFSLSSGTLSSTLKSAADIQVTAEIQDPGRLGVIDSSCGLSSPKFVVAQAHINGPSDGNKKKYVACLKQLTPKYVSIGDKFAKDYYTSRSHPEASKGYHVRCESKVAGSARFDEGLKSAIFDFDWATKSDQETIDRAEFHELLHSVGLNDAEIRPIGECCNDGFDNSKAACQSLLSPVNQSTGVATDRMSGKKEPNTIFDGKKSTADNTRSFITDVKPDDTLSKSPSDLKPRGPALGKINPRNPVAMKAYAEQQNTLIEVARHDAEEAFREAEPIKRLAAAISLPQAQAQEKSPAAEPHEDQTRSVGASSSDGTDSFSNSGTDRKAFPTIETKVVGLSKSGVPQLQLPNGQMVNSYPGFKNLVGSVSNSEQTSAAGKPEQPKPVAQSGLPLIAKATVGGKSKIQQSSDATLSASKLQTSTSGNRSGESGEVSTGGRNDAAANALNFSSQYSLEQLKLIPVKSARDVLSVVKKASNPRELLSQPWFLEKLKDDKIRIQIEDGENVYGSSRPVIRWNAKYLFKSSEK